MKTLPNGLRVLEGDSHLSRWVEEQGILAIAGDVALRHNLGCIKLGDVVIDGGAALGDHTSAYLDKVGPTGKVYAFEPNPAYFECLTINCPGAACHQVALWSKSMDLAMDFPKEGNIGAAYVTRSAGTAVSAVALDDLSLERCDFLKLDIEGAELMALKGATGTIDEYRPTIQCEINPPLMEALGYKPSELENWLATMGYTSVMFGTPSPTGACELVAWHSNPRLPRYKPNATEIERMAQ